MVCAHALLSVAIAAAAPAAPPAEPSVASWVQELSEGTPTEERRAELFAALRAAAARAPGEPETREAMFALAGLLDEANPAERAEAVRTMRAAVALFPEDARTPGLLGRLAPALIAAGDRHGGHFILTRLLQAPAQVPDPVLLVTAAENAIAVGDAVSAFAWAGAVAIEEISPDRRTSLARTKLIAAASLDRPQDALHALEQLEAEGTAPFVHDELSLLAAAKTEWAAGRLESAARRYERFANVFTTSPHRPAAMLAQGRILAEDGHHDAAVRSYDWLLEQHPQSSEADMGRIERIASEEQPDGAARMDAYEAALEIVQTTEAARLACSRLLALMLAQDRPLDAVSTLGRIARTHRGIAAAAARVELQSNLEALMGRLASRNDSVGLVAAEAMATSLALPVPEPLAHEIRRARSAIGLVQSEEADELRALARAERWAELEAAAAAKATSVDLDPVAAAARAMWLATAQWRQKSSEAALATIRNTLAHPELPPEASRQLVVLLADIEYAEGDLASACSSYRQAAAIRDSPWVAGQLRRCPAEEPPFVGPVQP